MKGLFSEKQAAEVLRRASRLQNGDDSHAPGLTHEEVLSIAAEAGIDPANVEAAIRDLESNRRTTRFLNLAEEEERIVDVELDPAEFDVILEVVKAVQTRHRPARQVGRTLTMTTRYKGSLYSVEVTSRKGRTRIEVASLPFMAYFMSLHPALFIGLMVGAFLTGHGFHLAAVLFAIVALAAGLSGFAALIHRAKENTSGLVDLIEAKILETDGGVRKGIRATESIDEEPSLARTRSA